ncbi:MAG: tetratricopeptide (TPR) repeat protein [Planctomycetota bacterium]|jgi:tetratricopeptide (TPR) repeat protein
MEIKANKDAKIQQKLAELTEDYEDDSQCDLLTRVALFFYMANDTKRTIASLKAAVASDPEDVRARFLLARTFMKEGRYRDGGKELEIVSDIDSVALGSPTWANNNLYYIGYALFQTDRYKEAAEAFLGAQHLINIWGDAMTLKRFHLHQGFSWHLEGQYNEAAECYRRALIAPGPGDSCDEDVMDEQEVEASQGFNDEIEPYLIMAQKNQPVDREDLPEVTPTFP